MKKLLVIVSFLLAFAGTANAQADWNTAGNFFTSGTPVLGSNSGTYPIIFRTGGINRAILTDAGDWGIGVTSPTARLDVWAQVPSNTTVNNFGVKSELIYAGSSFFPWFDATAVSGKSTSFTNGYGNQIGVYGEGIGGMYNYGGEFKASGSGGTPSNVYYNFGISTEASGNPTQGNFGGSLLASGNGGFNTGVSGTASGSPSGQNIGVFGNAVGNSAAGNIGGFFRYGFSANPANDWAVFSNGDSYATSFWINSDKKLKDNIQPVINVMGKIMLLKPSTYTYRREEFKDLNLPVGEQTGLIAQELETVFPEFVRKVNGMTVKGSKGEADIVIPEYKTVNYISLIPVLISGIQEQQKQIEGLQARLAALENTPGTGSSNTNTDGFVLEQNMPNPFSGETRINYSLPSQIKNASLLVYDLTGKQISSFPIDTKASSITITSEKLAAGIYIYSVVADGKIMDSKRMVVADKQ